MKSAFITVLAAVLLGFPLPGNASSEADLIEAAEGVVRSSLSPEEKIERLEIIEGQLVSIRRKRQTDPGGPAPKKTVARETETKPAKSEVLPTTPVPVKTADETESSPGFFSRMLFWLLRFLGFVAGAGLFAATVFVLASNGRRIFGFFKNIRNSATPATRTPLRTAVPPPIGSAIGGRSANPVPRTRNCTPQLPPASSRNRIPRDGAVPTHLC